MTTTAIHELFKTLEEAAGAAEAAENACQEILTALHEEAVRAHVAAEAACRDNPGWSEPGTKCAAVDQAEKTLREANGRKDRAEAAASAAHQAAEKSRRIVRSVRDCGVWVYTPAQRGLEERDGLEKVTVLGGATQAFVQSWQ